MWLCSGKRERLGYKRSGFDPTVTIFFLLIETFSITSQNGSERLRNGNLQRNLQRLHKTLPRHKSRSQIFRSSPMFVLYFSNSFMINPENTKEINV